MDVASELATLTDEDGKFTLTGLAPGDVALHALRADGSEAWDLAVAVGQCHQVSDGAPSAPAR